MFRRFLPGLLAGAGLLILSPLFGASVEPLSPDERARRSGAVCRGSVESLVSFRGENGFIYTEATIHVNEAFKGRFPPRFQLRYRGGLLEDEGETVVAMPAFKVGEERLFFLSLGPDGNLAAEGGPEGAPLVKPSPSDAGTRGVERMRQLFPRQAEGINLEEFGTGKGDASLREEPVVTPSSVTANGLLSPERRFTLADRGEPIPYLVDADALPAGISLAEALDAVENALFAWTEVSSLTFRFEGIESFGMAADDVPGDDGRLRIQLHDSYGAIGGSSTLGIGGQGFSWISEFNTGGTGGGVNGLEFHRTTRAFVVVKHSATSMQNLLTFEAVLCHEIGHSLGLAHSSEDSSETDSHLSEAMMYYLVHSDGRGAALTAWDLETVEKTHPESAPPPFGFDRVLRVVTSIAPLTNPEVNQMELPGYSLHESALTAELFFPSASNGAFSLSGTVLTFTPDAAFSDSGDELDPAGSQFYDQTYARFSDGTNLSPPISVRVTQFLLDTMPFGAPDGLPNSWAEIHFGSTSPAGGFSEAGDDADRDGRTNLQEFLLGTDPRDPNSRFTVTAISSGAIEFQARPYEVYELHESSDLLNWELNRPAQPTSSAGEFAAPPLDGPSRFFRVERVE